MTGKIIFRVALGLLLVAAVAMIGVYAYNAGVAQGLATNLAIAPPAEGGVAPVVPHYGYSYHAPFLFHRPFGFGRGGFGPLGCLFPLLFILLFFGLMRGAFWGKRWGGHWGPGWRHDGPGEHGVPSMFEEWHRRAHGEQPAEPAQK